jgi:flavin-dependent dehydrogenase
MQGVSAEAPFSAAGVQRLVLDEALLRACIDNGVDVRTGVEARKLVSGPGGFGVEIEGEAVEARVLVAADGARSGLRVQAGLDRPARRRRYGISAHLRLEAEPAPRIDIRAGQGYELYLTPAGERLVNAALLLERETMDELAGRLQDGFLELISLSLRDSAFELVDEPLVAGPFPAVASSLWRQPNLVLVGDAAGFNDGISGDGMSLALQSARYCAEAIDAFLDSGSTLPFRRYERRCRLLARNSRLFTSFMLALAARPALGVRALRNLSHRPATMSKLAAINSGDLGFRSLRPRDLLALAFGV